MEKAVKGATKEKLAAPKSKYIEQILAATRHGDSGVADVFRTLQLRLRDSTWTIVFKSLIVVHLMIRKGHPDTTIRFVAEAPKRIAISAFTEVQTQGHNIRRYYEYLLERAKAYQTTKTDFVKAGTGKMRNLTVDKGLLRQTELVQEQIKMLLRCDFLDNTDYENEIAVTAFRLCVLDLLELFKVMNEGTINVLEHYFEMSKVDAGRALNIYKSFSRLTDQVVQYLGSAKRFETYTQVEVPKLKHAPTTLTTALEDHLNDPDFEINRRQFLAQQEAKKSGKPVSRPTPSQSTPFDTTSTTTSRAPTTAATTTATATASIPAKGPAPDLIDFFESIEEHQQPMAQPGYPQQQFASAPMPPQSFQPPQMPPQMPPQQTGYNPFAPNFQQPQESSPPPPPPPPPLQQLQSPPALQPDFTGAGFGGYGPQPVQNTNMFGFQPQLSSIPQDDVAIFQQPPPQSPPFQPAAQPLQAQPTSTNPFRQSTIIPQKTNPFAPSTSPAPQQFVPQQQQQQQQLQPPQMLSLSPLQTQPTGTNPFAKNRSPPPPVSSPIAVNVTGSTNPFRQSQFVSQATGQGWQHSTQGTFAGYDMNNVQTMPVFPRPGAN